MASTENSTETNYEAWIQKCPNFTLVMGSGEELKCHKSFLAMHSPVFETMINSEFKEAKSDRADIKYFDTMGSILPSVTSNLCKLSRLRTKHVSRFNAYSSFKLTFSSVNKDFWKISRFLPLANWHGHEEG